MTSAGDTLGYAGKRVVVSGCFSGIGEATARILAELGAEVHGLDVKESRLLLASFTSIDLRDPASIDRAVANLSGPIDAIFNCAGIPPGPPPVDVMKVNYLGARYLTDRLLCQLGAGSAIVNVASNGGMHWSRHLAELRALVAADSFADGLRWCERHSDLVGEGYRLSKEALIVWTMVAATQTIARGIRMNCTLPGAVQTPMLEEIEKVTASELIDTVAQPIGRRSTVDEQAMALIFLNSPGASYINGATLPVDGGFLASLAIAS